MRLKTLATILLAIFVVTAVAAIVMQRPAPAATADGRQAAGPAPTGSVPHDLTTPAFRDVLPEMTTSAATQDVGKPAEKRDDAPAPLAKANRTTSVPAAVPAEPPAQKRRIVATYFHGNVRCATCRKVEAYAREAVEEGFRPEVAAGVVEFRAVNVELAENTHFVEDFRLTNKSVIVTEEVDGVVARWAKLDEVWGLVGNHDACLGYVRDAVRGYLETQ